MEHLLCAEPGQRSVDTAIARLAAKQFGVFSRTQAMSLGATRSMIRHRVQTGRWETIAPDVFRPGGAPTTWRQLAMAAVLAWGEGAVLSHRAAAALWRLAGCEPGVVEVTVPRRRKREQAPGVVHRGVVRPDEVTTAYGITVTTVERTLLDLATVVGADVLEDATDDAIRRGRTSLRKLRAYAERSGNRPGVQALRAIVDARDPRAAVPASVFESKLRRELRRAGYAEPVSQFPVERADGRHAYIDFAYPDAMVAIEADSYAHHSGRRDWEHDRARRNELTVLGWKVIHITWRELQRRPAAVMATIAAALNGDA